MGKQIHKKKINDKLTLVVEDSNCPDYPGIYVYAMAEVDGKEEEVGCVLLEFHDDILKSRVWDHKRTVEQDDPISTELFSQEERDSIKQKAMKIVGDADDPEEALEGCLDVFKKFLNEDNDI